MNIYKKLIKFIKNQIFLIFLKIFSNNFKPGYTYFILNFNRNKNNTPERYFKANKQIIPIYTDYRYSVKPGWANFKGLVTLYKLNNLKKLNSNEISFFENAKGRRTINFNIDEINKIALDCVQKNKNFFLKGSEDENGLPEFLPNSRLLKITINKYKNSHIEMLKKLSALKIYDVKQGSSILEIGYISGGFSIQAFEQIGFKASGIDNFYNGLVSKTYLYDYIKKINGSEAEYLFGDITQANNIQSESFDVIYSSSVIEHIQNTQGAFSEMFRILKPRGALIHNYSPYFSHDGGHAFGTGDSPWAHVRLNQDDYLRYISELRPNEAKVSIDWIKGALNRTIPQWRMQRIIAESGFKIILWSAKPSSNKFLSDLTQEVISDCYQNNPDISLIDLISQSVSFVAIK